MNEDLKIIRKNYGEKMMHLCRELFPTLLEKQGLLSHIMLENFAPSKFLYEDIIKESNPNAFKNYIYQLVDNNLNKLLHTSKTPKELLSEAGYDLYVCETEEDIQKFRKYYKPEEELCTFKQGNRLNHCHVFFAVKKDVDQIKRENFSTPRREDDYGVSVISIQFSRGRINTLSIKNRYNHIVNNPDATFANNLENIIPGLTESFQREYNLNINQNDGKNFDLPGYVKANDGKFYKYNYERDNIYYCPNNIIIDTFEVKYFNPQEYVLLDDFVLDLKNKIVELYDEYRTDSFVDGLKNIEKISIIKSKETNTKEIKILMAKGKEAVIQIDKYNRIIGYKNNEITKIEDNFLFLNRNLKKIELESVTIIGDRFLKDNRDLVEISMPNLKRIGDYFLCSNIQLQIINFPKLIKIGNSCLNINKCLREFIAPNLIEVGDDLLHQNTSLVSFIVPSLVKIGNHCLYSNKAMTEIECPRLSIVGDCFLSINRCIKKVFFPRLKKVGYNFLHLNQKLTSINFSKLNELDFGFLEFNENIINVNLPKLDKRSKSVLSIFNKELYNILIKNVKKSDSSLTHYIKQKTKTFIKILKQEIGGKSK